MAMSTTSKSPRKVALVAVEVGTDALPLYAHRFSPRKFTQSQLCLPAPGAILPHRLSRHHRNPDRRARPVRGHRSEKVPH